MQHTRELYERCAAELEKAVFGQADTIELLLIGLLSEGHVLIEGVPGTAKTLLVRCLAMALDCDYKRIQFTPDLMPADVIGTNVFDMRTSEFTFKPGPVFANLVLGDEINRAPPKAQAALLQAMQEHAVTVDGIRYDLASPFMVFATQNPIEQEGTYPLPEAELDRFMFKVLVDYPDESSERRVLAEHHTSMHARDLAQFGIAKVADAAALTEAKRRVREVGVRDEVIDYVSRLGRATRNHVEILLGASPRAGVTLLVAAKARASFQGRDYVTPDDVKHVFLPTLRHRVVLRPTAELERASTDSVLQAVLAGVEVPR